MDVRCFKIHERVARVRAVADVSLLTVVDATKVGVRDVPERTGEVFFPVLDAVFVLVTGFFSAGRVGFALDENTVEFGVFLAVVKGIAD